LRVLSRVLAVLVVVGLAKGANVLGAPNWLVTGFQTLVTKKSSPNL